jgi:hypothetical protein
MGDIFEVPVKPNTSYLVEVLARPVVKFMNTEYAGGQPTSQFGDQVNVDPDATFTAETRPSGYIIGVVVATPQSSGKADGAKVELYEVGTKVVFTNGKNFDLAGTKRQVFVQPWDIVGEWVSPELPVEVDTITVDEYQKINESTAEFAEQIAGATVNEVAA